MGSLRNVTTSGSDQKWEVMIVLKLSLVSGRRTFFGRGNEIHYIGGTEILPAPLDTAEEQKMIHMLGTVNEETARSMLIERNLRLVVYIAKKFDNTGIGVEDLISIGTIGLIKAINTFNPAKKIKLATYASRCIENEILMYLRRNNKTKMEVSIDEPLNVDWDGNELLLSDILGTDEDIIYKDLEHEVDKKLLTRAMTILTDREKMIIELRFGINQKEGKEKTQKEVADMLGINDAKGGGRSSGHFTVLHIKTGEKDHQTPEKRNDQDGMCINLQKN